MIETIKASGAENGYFRRWAGFQASVGEQNVKLARLNQTYGTIPAFITTLANALVLVLGIHLCMRGQFTLGMVTAFQSFLASFISPAMTMVTAGQTLQEMRTQMERVEDVMEYPEDEYFSDEPVREEKDYGKLSGELELRNVTFGYSKLDPPLIENFSLHIKPGGRVALVGASGCGKSTVSKLISGLYQPWSGEILFDGKPISQIDRDVFTGSVAVVDQDVILFNDTIANNIKMWDESIEDFEMILAARDAQIHDDIMARPGGYQSRITEGGRDLSGGQRQRLEIARVLAQDPHIGIMDEATSGTGRHLHHYRPQAIQHPRLRRDHCPRPRQGCGARHTRRTVRQGRILYRADYQRLRKEVNHGLIRRTDSAAEGAGSGNFRGFHLRDGVRHCRKARRGRAARLAHRDEGRH